MKDMNKKSKLLNITYHGINITSSEIYLDLRCAWGRNVIEIYIFKCYILFFKFPLLLNNLCKQTNDEKHKIVNSNNNKASKSSSKPQNQNERKVQVFKNSKPTI